MASFQHPRCLQVTFYLVIGLTALIVPFLMYQKSKESMMCPSGPVYPSLLAPPGQAPNTTPGTSKPVLLLWFWPEDKKFDLRNCERIFRIDGCSLTDDRSLYSGAMGVLMYHRAIQDDLSNLPTSPRPRFQKWIWLNMDTPNNTRRIEGIRNLFNVTLSYRSDADIQVRWRLTAKKNTNRSFVLPEKKRLLCWIVDRENLQSKAEMFHYYQELVEHIHVDLFERSKVEDYFQTISSCKFYLSFEDSRERDFITERFTGPLAAGTVPVVLGPPRRNYEDFAPGSSFIHVNDFSSASELALHLQALEKNDAAFMRYFDWRQFYSVRRHLTEEENEFVLPVCRACRYLGTNKDYRTIPDLYRWLSE